MRASMPLRTRRTILVLLCAGLAACVARAPLPSLPAAGQQVPADFPEAVYRQAYAEGKNVLRVNPGESLAVIEVRRGGPLARMGHDHVVASHDLQGYVMPDSGRADLYLPLSRLTVDEAPLRAEAGMESQPAQDAIEGTQRNMLEKVLEAERFPFVLLHIERDASNLRVAITLHGQTRSYTVPADIQATPERITVNGKMTIAQSDFGMTPYSVLGGALQVQDKLEMRYRIVAKPVAPFGRTPSDF
ncbi:YceI family protein [Herbaspirillum sp. HC18]|nr:YceI family protein [Herbaspirillum sp. HC18]